MKLLPRRFANSETTGTASEPTEQQAQSVEAMAGSKGYTPAKGRPTPKRREAENRQRGPVAPPPRTQREALKRSKGNKDERKKAAVARRAASAERRERMANGDERYLLPRDKGPVRAYVRDLVDARRNLAGLFMPLAGVIFVGLFFPLPAVTNYVTMLSTLMLLAMLIEGVIQGVGVVKRVRAKFPEATERGLLLGWYAFVRSSQIRRIRMPKARVKPGQPLPR
ncbi:MAG: DUF3043 domain-containing protein [Sciscionella sp.]